MSGASSQPASSEAALPEAALPETGRAETGRAEPALAETAARAGVPVLDGIHHLKLPVTDLARSLAWYRSRLGYDAQVEFVEQGTLMGVAMAHPAGGPDLALRLDPDRARAAAGFDYFAIGLSDRAAIEALARHLDELGQPHAGVHRASFGWILPEVLDPDGHTLRFYTKAHHTDVVPGEVATVRDPRETAGQREREELGAAR